MESNNPLKSIVTAALLLLTLSTSAQSKITVNMGVSYQPMFLDGFSPLQDNSLTPSLDVFVTDKMTSIKMSIGASNRIGIYVVNPNGLVFGVNYAYHINQVIEASHSLEVEIGYAFLVGRNKDYLITLTTKGGSMLVKNRFYLCPVSIGIVKRL